MSFPFAAILAVGASAQHPMGFISGWERGSGGITMYHNPQSTNVPEGDFLNRIDTDDYKSWGRDPVQDPTYGTFCIYGVQFVVADLDLATPEYPVYVSAWTEDPGKPDFPDLPGFDPMTGGSNFLFGGPIPRNDLYNATEYTFTFLTPVCVPTEGDIFVGVNIGPDGAGGGMLTPAVGDGQTPVSPRTVWDDPGPGAAGIAQGSYVCILPTQTPLNGIPLPTGASAVYTFYRAQNYFEVYLQNASGGVCTAVTNQANFNVSSPANGNGTTNLLSGVHPDVGNVPLNPGRNLPPPIGWTGDRLGYTYTDSRLVEGDPVFVVIALMENVPPFRLVDILGGGAHTGRVLVDIILNFPAGAGLATAVSGQGYARFETSFDLPSSVRAFLKINHRKLMWQGLGLDGDLAIHAAGLSIQSF